MGMPVGRPLRAGGENGYRAFLFLGKNMYCFKQEKGFFLSIEIFFFWKMGVTEVTRSARRYCKTGATLGRGGTQAYQALSRGLNNPLKLL